MENKINQKSRKQLRQMMDHNPITSTKYRVASNVLGDLNQTRRFRVAIAVATISAIATVLATALLK